LKGGSYLPLNSARSKLLFIAAEARNRFWSLKVGRPEAGGGFHHADLCHFRNSTTSTSGLIPFDPEFSDAVFAEGDGRVEKLAARGAFVAVAA